MQTAVFCALPAYDNDLPLDSKSLAVACAYAFPDTACSTVLASAFHWFSTSADSYHILQTSSIVLVNLQGSDFLLEPCCWSGFVCGGCGLVYRHRLESFPSSLQATSGWHVHRDVIAPKGVQIKYLGDCGLKAASVYAVWNLIFFSFHFALTCICVCSVCLSAFALPSLLIFFRCSRISHPCL